MRQPIVRFLLAVAALPLALAARAEQRPLVGQLDFGITYAAGHANYVPDSTFWMQGGSIELVGHVPYGFAAVADITGLHAGASGPSTVPINLVTDTFGPRYTALVAHRKSSHPIFLFGQGLIGEAHGLRGLYPGPNGTTSSALSFALQLGGGADIALSPHLTLRAAQVGWLRTQLPNGGSDVQNDLRVGAGIVFHTRGGR
jgi:hypothetical protein